METMELCNGIKIPAIGYGTWRTPDGDICEMAVKNAIQCGYTHIDTAVVYKNERSVGKAIRDSKVAREKLFITSKLWNDCRGYENTKKAFYESLDRLGLEYLDLYLIHWPNPLAYRDCWEEMNAKTWRAMEELYEEGKIKAIGVSNFRIHHLESLMKSARIMPMVNQIECTLGFTQQDVIDYCQQHDIVVEGWSPLGSGRLFTSEALHSFTKKYEKSAAQITLRYLLEKGVLPLPKSTNPQRMKENLDIFDFVLEEDDIARMDALTVQIHSGNNPDTVNF